MKSDELISNLLNIASQMESGYCISLTTASTRILIQPKKHMTTTEEITKDQQIQNQSETIQSLERKVQSLETELQKCLNLEGDSDSTRNGKADVLPELNDTEKQILLSRTETKAKEMIRGCLGFRDGQEHSNAWVMLRTALLDDAKIDSMRGNKHFKYGMQTLMYITDTMLEVEAWSEEKRREDRVDWLAGQLLDTNEDDYKSLLKLIEAFDILTKDPAHAEYHGIRPEDINDLRIDLTTISRCHRMVLDAYAKWK